MTKKRTKGKCYHKEKSEIEKSIGFALLVIFLLVVLHSTEGRETQMEKFINPPQDTRILKIVHSLPDSAEQQEALFKLLLSQGFGGVVCNVSFNDYLESEEKWEAFVRGVKKAKELGMALWLYDERGYPSGTAGGLTLRGHPEWEARGLFCLDREFRGETEVNLEIPPGKFVGAWAFPKTSKGIELDRGEDLSPYVRGEKLVWKVPQGDWQIVVISENRLYENTHAAVSLADKLPYINLLMPEPTRRFIEVTHERYARYLGDDLGKYFIATFTDEPSLMSLFFLATPYRPLPWAPHLAEEFLKRRGYDLMHYIPLLFVEGENSGKIRYDFWQTVGELVAENFFGQIRDWCRKHNIASGGHLLMEESLTAHIALYGNFFLCLKYLDAPGIDCLTSIPAEVPWKVARLAGSVKELNHNTYTMCETSDFIQVYRPQGDTRPVRTVSEEEIRGTCNRLIHGGINTITSYYTFRDLTDEQLQNLNTWVGRCCTMMRAGYQLADIAVLYPAESLWTHFRPARLGATDSPIAHRIEAIFNQVSDSLYNANRDFLYIDTPTLLSCSLKGDSLVYDNLSWRVIILPGVDTLPLKAWEKLREFWIKGGVVIAVGAMPQNSEEDFPSPQVEKIGKELFGREIKMNLRINKNGGVAVFLPQGFASLLPALLDRLIEPDVGVRETPSPLRITHRKIEGHDVYFIINDSDKPCKQSLSFKGEKGEIWDPKDGSVKPLPEGKWIEMEFEPYGAIFVRFPRVKAPRRLKPQRMEDLFRTSTPTFSAPTMVRGEFVEGEIKEVEQRGKKAWQARGKLIKGNVDCFLFLSFHSPHPLDLGKVRHLLFNITIPKGQKSLASIFVILRDVNGIEYIADTGALLSDEGEFGLFVPLRAFNPIPWGKGASLDWSQITAISIGWGGYYGEEGEELYFTSTAPQLLW